MGGHIEFRTGEIDAMASTTMAQGQVWDDIWNRTYTNLKAVAGEALDQLTGASLEQRNAEYNQRSQVYRQEVTNQSTRDSRISTTATETNQQMVRTIQA
jgi:hypothetical protein